MCPCIIAGNIISARDLCDNPKETMLYGRLDRATPLRQDRASLD